MSLDISNATFHGYVRENGRVGVRNHVLILPVDDISNAAVEAVGNNVKGTLPLPHPYGRLQFGADLDLHFRTLIGAGSNPNVAAVVVIGIEPEWTGKVVEGIAATGKPVSGFWIEKGQISYPVAELTIAGNLKDMFKSIVAIGNDVDLRGNIRTGSVLIEKMTIAGE